MTTFAAAMLPLAAILTLASALLYAALDRSARRATERPATAPSPLHRLARFLFYLQTGCVEVAAAVLMSSILTHRFDLDYVFTHSSTDLPFLFLVSSFWSGQEGTFLLWALYGSLLGCLLIARSRDWEPTVMMVWGLMHLLVLGLLLAHSPFAATDLHRFSANDQTLFRSAFGGIPPEGQGLNPLLQNYWMAIHPPILFLGFCGMGLPFCFALAGMLRRDLDGWAWRAQGWTLFAWCVLGTGLILGGYWAYETLGWGGYWAWDPVENSSLVPWLFAGALFHGLLLQRQTRGSLRRLNLALAALAYGAVVYGSYLNRSGVLSDFSVHSFVALSPAFNRALVAFAVLPLVTFLALYVRCGRGAPRVELSPAPLSRKQLLHWVTLLLAGSGSLVLIGNSWPLISGLLTKLAFFHRLVPQTTSLQQPFYNQTHTPFAALLAVLLAVVMHTSWDSARKERLLEGLRWPMALAGAVAGFTAGAIYTWLRNRTGHPEWLHPTAGRLALAWGTVVVLCALAAAVNARVLIDEWRRGERLGLGAHLAHTGFMVLVIGVVVSSVYETKAILNLPQGQPVTFAGYELTYDGLNPVGENAEILVTARQGEDSHRLRPLLRPGQDGMIRNPAALKTPTYDLYLEPGEIQMGQHPDEVILSRQEPAAVGDLTFTFVRFALPEGKLTPQNFRVGVVMKVQRGKELTEVTAWFVVVNGQLQPAPAKLPGGGTVTVTNLPDKGDGSGDRVILLRLDGTNIAAQPETAVMQVTLKPLMSVVWLGCWLTILGGALAALRRARIAAGRVMARGEEGQ